MPDDLRPSPSSDEFAKVDDQRRRIYLNFQDVVQKHWKDIFGLNKVYHTSYARDLFWTLWRAASPGQDPEWVSFTDAATYMPELRSLAGARSFLQTAISDKFLDIEERWFRKSGTKDEVSNPTEKQKKELNRVERVRLSERARSGLDACFDQCAIELEFAARRMPRVVSGEDMSTSAA